MRSADYVQPTAYTKPGTRLRQAEVRHLLNGFVSPLAAYGTPIDETLDTVIPEHIARRLVLLGPALAMNYRIIRVGTRPMLFGRPIRKEDA